MKYKISQLAGNDIKGIWNYTNKKWSRKQADRYYNLILDEIEYIAENPETGKDFSHVIEGYFRSQISSHFIFYKIDQKEDKVEIIRVLHQRMDIESRLTE